MLRMNVSSLRAVACGGRVVALGAALAFGVATPTAALAQTSRSNVPTAARSAFLDRSAVFNGYTTGYARGARDSSSRAGFAPKQGEAFENSTSGYTSDMGPVAEYQTGFQT